MPLETSRCRSRYRRWSSGNFMASLSIRPDLRKTATRRAVPIVACDRPAPSVQKCPWIHPPIAIGTGQRLG